MNEETIWIASFDIGKINFSLYIEEINIKKLNVKNIEKNKRYNSNGTCTDDFSKLLKDVYGNGKRILLKNVNLTSDTNKNKYFDIELCHNLVDILDEYREYWDKVSIFIVEQQMSFGKKVNTMALKLGQHTESYFIFNYGRFKKVIEFPAYYKTQVLGCEKIEKKLKNGKKSFKNIDKYARKKWSVEKVFSVLAERNDFDTMSEISSMKKQDDVADVIIQLQSFKYLYFIEKMKF